MEYIQPKHISEVVDLYIRTFRPGVNPKYNPEVILRRIKNDRVYGGFKFGSKWNTESRLSFKRVSNSTDIIPYCSTRVPPHSVFSAEALLTAARFKKVASKILEGYIL
jgi:hypothetical protein